MLRKALKNIIWPWTPEEESDEIRLRRFRVLRQKEIRETNDRLDRMRRIIGLILKTTPFYEDTRFEVTAYKGHALNYPVNTSFFLHIWHPSTQAFFGSDRPYTYDETPEAVVYELMLDFASNHKIEVLDHPRTMGGVVDARLRYNGRRVRRGKRGGFYYVNRNGKREYIPRNKVEYIMFDRIQPSTMMEFWFEEDEKFWGDKKRVIPEIEIEKLQKKLGIEKETDAEINK